MEWSSILLSGGAIAAVVTAISVIVQVILNKKLRTPADRTSEVTAVMNFYREGIADSRADRLALEATVKDLREYVASLESKSREDFSLRTKLEARVADLERRIQEKETRIHHLEDQLKVYTGVSS